MKILHFNYKKKNGEEREANLLVLQEDSTYMQGIDLSKLSKEEIETVKYIQKMYESSLKPFMKAYRNFIKESVVGEIKEEIEKT